MTLANKIANVLIDLVVAATKHSNYFWFIAKYNLHKISIVLC